jgi:hypothetical protein
VVGAPGFELGASCAQGNCKKSISLVRLALFCVMVPGFGPNLSAFGPKWTQVFFSQLGRRQVGARRVFPDVSRDFPLSRRRDSAAYNTLRLALPMTFHLSGIRGIAVVLLVLFAPAALVAYLLHSAVWLVAVPLVITALALLAAALPIKRKVTPEQFADELERHLLGTEGNGIGTTQPRLPLPMSVWSEFVWSFQGSILWLWKKTRTN